MLAEKFRKLSIPIDENDLQNLVTILNEDSPQFCKEITQEIDLFLAEPEADNQGENEKECDEEPSTRNPFRFEGYKKMYIQVCIFVYVIYSQKKT